MQVKFQHQIEDNEGGTLDLVNFKSTMNISPVSIFVFWLSFSTTLTINTQYCHTYIGYLCPYSTSMYACVRVCICMCV